MGRGRLPPNTKTKTKMNTNSNTNETAPTATDPSTAVALEETCEHCGAHEEDNALFEGNNGEFDGLWLCRACVALDDALEDEEAEEKKETEEETRARLKASLAYWEGLVHKAEESDEEEEEEEEGGCVYCHSKEVVAHCEKCDEHEAGDDGAMCQGCWRTHGNESEGVPWCGGCWREEAEAFAEEFPNAKCAGCSKALTRETRALCGGQGGCCETFYCYGCVQEVKCPDCGDWGEA